MTVILAPLSGGRFFIRVREGGAERHAGGITLHSVCGARFGYGIAIAPAMRRRGVACAALTQLFMQMRAQGYTHARVQVSAQNAASLALHRALGFACVDARDGVFTLERALTDAAAPAPETPPT